jgi:hypothetical protein
MIKKLRNQAYAPKVGASSQVGTRGSIKKYSSAVDTAYSNDLI